MTPMRTGYVTNSVQNEAKELVRWQRGPEPFRIFIQNLAALIKIGSDPEQLRRGNGLQIPERVAAPWPSFQIEIPAAVGGVDQVEDEVLYFVGGSPERTAMVNYLVQPSAGDTLPSLPQSDEALDAEVIAAFEADPTCLSSHYPKEEAMPVVLQPIDQTAKLQLAQQLACWAKQDNGMTDPAVQYGTCCVSPTGQTLGRWTIPDGLCTEYGAFPFTGNNGQEITCPPTQAEIMPYYIYDADVDPMDPNTCELIPEPLPTVTGFAASDFTAEGMTLTWDPVTGADGYTIRYSAGGGSWTTVTDDAPPQVLTGLAANTEYTLQIRATDSTGAALPSAWSMPPLIASTQGTPLAAPTLLTGSSPAAGQLSATWEAVPNAGGYVFEYSSDGGTTWNEEATAATNVGPLTVAAGTYAIRVKATAEAGSGFSDSPYATGADVPVL